MEKKIYIIQSFLIGLVCSAAFGQADFDKKLRSLYKNTVPLINDEVLITTTQKEKIILLDTRSSEEYNVSHLPNALFLDYDSFRPEDVSSLDRDSKIVVYCSVGYRSERIGQQLLKLGFKNVHNLYGGIFDWVNDGNKVINRSGITTDTVHTYNKEWSKWLRKGVKVY